MVYGEIHHPLFLFHSEVDKKAIWQQYFFAKQLCRDAYKHISHLYYLCFKVFVNSKNVSLSSLSIALSMSRFTFSSSNSDTS